MLAERVSAISEMETECGLRQWLSRGLRRLHGSKIFELTGQGYYQRVIGVTSGCVDPVPGCPGLKIDVDALWKELERLADTQE